ncbi:anaerobic ribonucleoside-triphosphate reductase [Vibrio alginolyticus]|uniref:anaerobic ribonucleoside-triphosphate reductase n=2 Tax=Vibrio harveyi group TaxID=717610 RepID=UPI00211A747D|nr:anaerobic ribonucleoside-triphosphate reductase [Vibrio alginolyticus]MCQ9070890.1 anaerobic ribonucleoside-triphosphate reductase [Vibrio alginolyticus]HCH3308231.1 anaerobic ribonucleoside-triphosphate reductase [Vibrio parahaemolyticus]
MRTIDKERMFDVVEEMFTQSNVSVMNENANKDARIIPTQRDLLAGVVSKEYALQKLIPENIASAHLQGFIHWHDLDYSPFFPMFNCMLIDLKGMLTNGFKMGNAEIEEPKSISTATAVTAQIIAQVSSHIYGGTTINRVDEVLAPYVRASYDKWLEVGLIWFKGDDRESAVFATQMVEKETYNAFQSLEYEINTLHTSNGQTPFVTLNFGLGRSWEERLIQKSILENRMAGLGKNKKTAIFPKLVFTIKKGLNFKHGDPNYDIKKLALKCASERMYPDILNYDKLIEVTGGFKAPMGCRSFLGEYFDESGVPQYDGRNNMGVVSLNLPRLALMSSDIYEFTELLDKYASLSIDALKLRIKRLDNVKASVAPILYCEGAAGVRLNPEDTVSEIFKHGRASVSLGYIGINETVNALLPEDKRHAFDSPDKRKLGLQIVARLRSIVDKAKEETGYAFSLYSTPSESLCDRFCSLDVKEFGVIEGVTDKDYYTNSFHLDVLKKVNPFEKIEFEQDYPHLANGGFIDYIEFPNMQHNLEGLERVWDFTYDRIPYFGTNTPIDRCSCGWSGEALATEHGFECPHCGNRGEGLSVTRRVCGYLGNPDSRPFNKGKQSEVMKRVKHQ